jgi:hypothetical protein
MKRRFGFVSNSSSSSFVIGKNFIPEDKYVDFIDRLSDLEDDESEEGLYFYDNKHYIIGNVSQHHEGFRELVDEFGLNEFVGYGD